jgi:gas vesicle protein
MFSRVRIAIRFFFVGLAVGVLLAPRSGEETRRLLREKADTLLNDVLDAATLGTSAGTRTGPTTAADAEEATDATTRARSPRGGNGSRTRTRSTAASEAGV